MRPPAFLGWIFGLLSPLVARLIGPSINRDTVGNIRKAGLRIVVEEDLSSKIFKFIVAERD